ncbi:MAG: hypothetical protein JNK53_06650, partial [Phycisphaerae bacterium]|nr:hypothetical protein [Phycisphaerae bacterium]
MQRASTSARAGALALACASAGLLTALAQTASADVLTNYWVSTGTFEYRVVHMPDLDQRRNGLANNGANHCVPTSTINLFGYAANHGYPWVAPGAANWESNANFNAATDAILTMGSLMSTSGTTGTNGSGSWN